MIAAVIASSRRESPEGRDPWADLLMAVNSVTLYAPQVEVVVAWQGAAEPAGFLDNPRLRLLRQPDACRSFGEAYGWAVRQTAAETLLLVNDDCVLLPDTVETLEADAATIVERAPRARIGFLACRSNFAPGPQNIRAANGGAMPDGGMRHDSEGWILPAPRVSPIAARIEREALDAIGGFPPINWYSDDLMCHDLRERGYMNFVSRAYVHHIGMRATTQDGVGPAELDAAGLEWVRRNRPDFFRALERAG